MSSLEGLTLEEREHQQNLDKELEAWEDFLKHVPDSAEIPENAEIPKQFVGLSDKEMEEVLYGVCETKDELRNWIKGFLNCDLPDTCIDPESNSNPLEMVWQLYRTAVHYDDLTHAERYLKSLFYCARGSFKTMCACIVELMIMLHTNRNVVHIGMIESQAKNAYNMYFRPFLDLPYIRDYAKLNSILERSTLKNKDGISVTLQVIPLTMNKTSSPRAQLVAKDEVDKVKGEQVQAYENVYGMLTMTNEKQMAMEFDISSRDSSHGMVQELIDSSEKIGCKVRHWNRIDITERCPDSRSGNVPIPIYIKKDTLIAIGEEEYDELDTESQKHYEMEWGLEGCLARCKMFAACKGYLKNQTSKCKWLKPVDETEQAITSAPSEEMAISQLLCRTPPRTGLVYSDFTAKRNMKTPNEMYELWKGEPHENNKLTTNMLITEFKKGGLELFIGVDAGYHHPAAIMMFVDEDHNVFIVKEYMPDDVDSVELAQWLSDNWRKHNPTRVFVDPESPDCTRAIKKKKFNVSIKVDKKRQPGIATVKGFIRLPTTTLTKLYVNRECMGTKYEFNRWSYKQDPDGNYSDDAEKKSDHAMDAIRYVLHTLYGQARGNLAYRQGHEDKDLSDAELKKKMVKDKLTPQAVAAILGQKVIDNRHILEDNEDDEDPKRSTTKYDFGEF